MYQTSIFIFFWLQITWWEHWPWTWTVHYQANPQSVCDGFPGRAVSSGDGVTNNCNGSPVSIHYLMMNKSLAMTTSGVSLERFAPPSAQVWPKSIISTNHSKRHWGGWGGLMTVIKVPDKSDCIVYVNPGYKKFDIDLTLMFKLSINRT